MITIRPEFWAVTSTMDQFYWEKTIDILELSLKHRKINFSEASCKFLPTHKNSEPRNVIIHESRKPFFVFPTFTTYLVQWFPTENIERRIDLWRPTWLAVCSPRLSFDPRLDIVSVPSCVFSPSEALEWAFCGIKLVK